MKKIVILLLVISAYPATALCGSYTWSTAATTVEVYADKAATCKMYLKAGGNMTHPGCKWIQSNRAEYTAAVKWMSDRSGSKSSEYRKLLKSNPRKADDIYNNMATIEDALRYMSILGL